MAAGFIVVMNLDSLYQRVHDLRRQLLYLGELSDALLSEI